MEIWQLGFGILQTIMLVALAWFIKLLTLFRNDLHDLEGRINRLERLQDVDEQKWINIREIIDLGFKQIEKMINRLEQKIEKD
ncbi:MAG: hypothetical protein H8E26_13085 [FCB group bacterium]|jgi:hypothetical protein|nr:hypothetical protein [FCB group bacterium]